MPASPSKYAENQFKVITKSNFPLMSELLSTSGPLVTAAALLYPTLVPAQIALATVTTAWTGGETILANAEATQLGATLAFTDRILSVSRKPDLESPSPLENWDATIRTLVAFGGSAYKVLLPHGRDTLTAGTYDEQLAAIRDFSIRLVTQGTKLGKPGLNTLGATVSAWYNAAKLLRDDQNAGIKASGDAHDAQELLRLNAAAELFGMTGLGMNVFKLNPAQVDTLYDVNLLRGPAQTIPTAPQTTVWTPATRTLSTAALPAGATRLEAWRQGPGGAPELLAIGAQGALEVLLPANFTFRPGDTYNLWLQARNSAGSSPASPAQTWVAG